MQSPNAESIAQAARLRKTLLAHAQTIYHPKAWKNIDISIFRAGDTYFARVSACEPTAGRDGRQKGIEDKWTELARGVERESPSEALQNLWERVVEIRAAMEE